jgi:hypothetical protein
MMINPIENLIEQHKLLTYPKNKHLSVRQGLYEK